MDRDRILSPVWRVMRSFSGTRSEGRSQEDPLVFSPLLQNFRAVIFTEPKLVAMVLQLALFPSLPPDQVFNLVRMMKGHSLSRGTGLGAQVR